MSNTQANLGKLWIFDPTKNRWASYESMLRRILAARTIEADGEKKVFLFNHIGPAAYESLEVAMNGQNMDSKSFDELCRVLTGIFEPKGLVASTRHKIFTAKQLADQTSKQFIQQVKSWSIKADFESVVNTRDFVQVQAIIAGLQDKKVKEKLLETPNLDMTKLEEIVELVEGSQSAAKEMAGSSASGTIARLDKKRQKKPLWGKSGKPKGRQGTCYTCGSSQHMQPYCPKRGQRQPPTNQGYQRRQNGRNSGIRAVLPESRYDSEVSSDEDDACLALEQEVEIPISSLNPLRMEPKSMNPQVKMKSWSHPETHQSRQPQWFLTLVCYLEDLPDHGSLLKDFVTTPVLTKLERSPKSGKQVPYVQVSMVVPARWNAIPMVNPVSLVPACPVASPCSRQAPKPVRWKCQAVPDLSTWRRCEAERPNCEPEFPRKSSVIIQI
uniref:CCHC-type domain-containing protein n=1 Tax=Bursaphelenchus xylophilus TaxID=6326 RepID=A0A1I7SB99_BURXY